MEQRPEIIYLPPVPSTSSGDARIWQHIFPENPSCLSRDPNCDSEKTKIRGPTFNLLEALTMDPVDDRTPMQSIRNTGVSDMESLEENVEQLIRETDEAFQAVGTALADAKAATQRWHDDPIQEHIPRNVSVSRSVFKKEPRPFATALKSPMTKTKSVAKGKKKAFYRKKNPLIRVRKVPPPSTDTPARWTFTDVTANMADIFNGKMFRTEVDEMLTPDRLRRLRLEEKIENERRISADSIGSLETNGSTPTEPFYLESLSSRLAAAELKETIIPSFPSPVPPIPQRRRGSGREAKITARGCGMGFQDFNFPSPPRILNRSNARGTRPLPTIPEISPLNFKPPLYPYEKSKERQFSFESIQPPPEYILLPSTSFTLTSPLFRQGPIRIERKEKELLGDDEQLDWTAFQMAISGTMDEIGVDERDDIEWAADETEVDDILEWWAGYGFLGCGAMIQGEPSGRPRADPMAIKTHRSTPRSDSGTDKIVIEASTQGESLRWLKTGYAESMPPSPMLEFVPPSPNKKGEVIPMGFNLGHDLGDFLDWETHYVRKYFVDD